MMGRAIAEVFLEKGVWVRIFGEAWGRGRHNGVYWLLASAFHFGGGECWRRA